MELEDLKGAWKQEANKSTTNPDMMQSIHQKSSGPLYALREGFRKQMVMIIVIMIMVITTHVKNLNTVSSHLFFWTYMGFCLALISAFAFNYRQVGMMERMENSVKEHLENQITLLQKRLKWQGIMARIVIIFFMILLEVVPLYQSLKMVNTWHALPSWVRFGSYALFLIFQYYFSSYIKQQKFGRHMDHLKDLLLQMK